MLTLGEAIIYSVAKRALAGGVSFTREWLRLEQAALEWHIDGDKQLKLAELLQKIIDEVAPDRDKLTEDTLDDIIAKWSKLL